MIGDFLLRLAIALPLVLLLALAVMLAMKRGLLPAPGGHGVEGPSSRMAGLHQQLIWWLAGRGRISRAAAVSGKLSASQAGPRLDLIASRTVLPGLRILVVRYAGHDLVLGAGPQGLALLSSLPSPVMGTTLPEGRAGDAA